MTVSNDNLPAGDDGGGERNAGLQRVRTVIDAEIARAHAVDRVAAVVLSETGMVPARRLRWLGIAATLVVAAGLGGLFEANRLQTATPVDVVVLDPLTFGAVAVDQ